MPDKLGPTLPGKVSKVKVKRSETAAQLAKMTPQVDEEGRVTSAPTVNQKALDDVMQRHIVLSAMGIADDDDEVELTTQEGYGVWPCCPDCKKQVDPVNYSLHVKGHGG